MLIQVALPVKRPSQHQRAPAAPGTPTDSATMTIQTPKGEVKIDMKNMEAMAKQMEAMSKQMEQNKK